MFVHTPVILAQIAVAANYNKLVLVNGVGTVLQNPAPDTVAVIDLKQFPPKIVKASPPAVIAAVATGNNAGV